MIALKLTAVFLAAVSLYSLNFNATAGDSNDGEKSNLNVNDAPLFNKTIETLRQAPPPRIKRFLGSETIPSYNVIVHSPVIADALKGSYTPEEIDNLLAFTAKARNIDTVEKPWGTFVQAASFDSEEMGQTTLYDSIWVRDSVWAYLALASEPSTKHVAKKVLLTLIDYMATPAQLERMRQTVDNPGILDGDEGNMKAVHIRFDSNSKTFDDVMESGAPQEWTHKQNDALGLLIDAAVTAFKEGTITLDELSENNRLTAIAGLIAYLYAADYHEMEDSGAWEEIARRNTSSIGLVASAVANLYSLIESPGGKSFAEAFTKAAESFGSPSAARPSTLVEMMFNGYDTIRVQLEMGGESPDYDDDDEHYRTADAALLGLIYPAGLERLSAENKLNILDIVYTLAGDYGIARYRNDDYQFGNYWFLSIKPDTGEDTHEQRRRQFIPGTEAEWFFDSWFALSSLHLYEDTAEPEFIAIATRHLNRALGQLTGDNALLADGQPAPAFAFPESYNFLVKDGEMFAAPSPICPLNWAKASLTLALKAYKRILEEN